MMASLDGHIDCAMTEQIESGDEYYEALDKLNCPSTLMGRVTMQMHYASGGNFKAKDAAPVGKESFHKSVESKGYIIAVDSKGSLEWDANEFDGMSLLVVTSEDCPKEYVDGLSEKGISWIAAGTGSIDLARAMDIAYREFGIKRLSVTGGGNINAAFLVAGLLDEVSMMYAPGIDGRSGMAAAFDGIKNPDKPATKLSLKSVERMGEVVWLRYAV